MFTLTRRSMFATLSAPVVTLGAAAAAQAQPGEGAPTNGPLDLRRMGASGDGATDDTAVFNRAFERLSQTRTSPPFKDGWGLGHITSPRGRYRFTSLTPPQSAVGLVWSGAALYATSNEWSLTTGHAVRLGPYVSVRIEDMSFLNRSAKAGDSVCFLLDGYGGGAGLTLRSVSIEGFDAGVRVLGTINVDTSFMQQCIFSSNVGFANGKNTQSVINMMLNCTSSCRDALFQTAGGSEMSIYSHNGVIRGSFLQFLDGSGSYQAGRTRVVNSKFEYHDAAADQLMIDARGVKSGGGNAIYWRDSALAGGVGSPTDYDAHRVVALANDSYKLDFEGGYLRGGISYTNDKGDSGTVSSFRYMEAAPLPSGVELKGTGTHPLMEWRANGNVAVDQYRGGQEGNRSVDGQKALLWRPPMGSAATSRYLVITGGGAHRTVFGHRIGGDFTVREFPPHTHIFGVAVFIQDASPGDTEVTLFADADFTTPLGKTLTLPPEARGLHRLSTQERSLPDGRLFVRVTRAGVDQYVAGALVVFYFPYFGVV